MKLIKTLGFLPKENSTNVYYKKYSSHNNYIIEIDLSRKVIDFGSDISFNGTKKHSQNITKDEDYVVLECIDRLLEKGYNPSDIILEKQWKTGHGTSGRLDILVMKNNAAYMMIECKVWGKEFEKEFTNLQKNGGQLFTYFQQDKNAEILVLYTSMLEDSTLSYKNEIIKIEDEYRATSNVKDFYDRWNKLSKNNGVFENYVNAYNFMSKALTKLDLQVLKQEDSSFIFNRFLEILRHNIVSDKPNAFNKIFTLFLCKIVDEDRSDTTQLHFQWLEGEDTHVSFQKRLSDLYTRGMKELLEKKVTDISDSELDIVFQDVTDTNRNKFKEMLTEIRLKKNNEFAIKEVYDDDSFNENAIVVKEIVELLQTYQIRYNYRQQFLSDFFELLLTTGLKQESGQFFTPVPLARFIIKSMPITKIVDEKIAHGDKTDLLPTIIDYAAGSGHFITESMEEVQKFINTIDETKLTPSSKKAIKKWKVDPFDWAEDYVYAIERDYRLVKTAKVSCYLHGDGLAKVIHGDGLADFNTAKEYKERLCTTDKTYPQDNKQFDIVISNPPYSVSSFKSMMDSEKAQKNFELFSRLTDQSSEIETLFIERTKQLLKDDGIAGIILPSSILSNTGIYTQSREIILNYFDIVSIVELGSNTFMATGTNTVILFLRRKNNADHLKIKASVEKLFTNKKDITINGIENPLQKYLSHVWESINVSDYLTLLDKEPNEKLLAHEITKEYVTKLKGDISEQLKQIVKVEKEKLLYFIMAYPQKITLVKTGEKKEEKKFLGYEFSHRRGSEGIHPTQRGKNIDECTSLYDENSYNNFSKVNAYIYSAFNGQLNEIDENLKNNISYINLIDMMNFDRVDFEKNISLKIKKKIKIESKWEVKLFSEIVTIEYGTRIVRKKEEGTQYPVYGGGGETFKANKYNRENRVIISRFGMSPKCVRFIPNKFFLNDSGFTISSKNEKKLLSDFLDIYIDTIQEYIYFCGRGVAQKNMDMEQFNRLKIPLPPKDIQEKIIKEIKSLEKINEKYLEKIKNLRNEIFKLIEEKSIKGKVSDLCKISKEKLNPQDNKEQEFCYLGLEHIESNTGKILFQNMEIGENIQSNKNIFNKGDILYGKLRPYLNKVSLTNFSGICSTDILVLKSDIPLILKYILLSNTFVEKTSSLMGGVSLPRIKTDSFLNIKISYPTFEKQSEIIIKIEAIEIKIAQIEKELADIPSKKEAILKKYL